MKCLACQFENPAHHQFCFRCTHQLDLREIEVDPPRRTRWGAHYWRWLPSSRLRTLRRRWDGLVLSRPVLWLVSILPGSGHLLLGYQYRGLAFLVSWIFLSLYFNQGISLRPAGFCMTLQCFAMTDAYRCASLTDPGWKKLMLVSLASAALLALVAMIYIGGILW